MKALAVFFLLAQAVFGFGIDSSPSSPTGGGGGGGFPDRIQDATVSTVVTAEPTEAVFTLGGNQVMSVSSGLLSVRGVPQYRTAEFSCASSPGTFGHDTLCDDGGVLSVRHGTGAPIPLEGAGAASTFVEQSYIPALGQTLFTLPAAYVGGTGHASIHVNSVHYDDQTYSISGTTLTWLDVPFTLDTNDLVVIHYQTN